MLPPFDVAVVSSLDCALQANQNVLPPFDVAVVSSLNPFFFSSLDGTFFVSSWGSQWRQARCASVLPVQNNNYGKVLRIVPEKQTCHCVTWKLRLNIYLCEKDGSKKTHVIVDGVFSSWAIDLQALLVSSC